MANRRSRPADLVSMSVEGHLDSTVGSLSIRKKTSTRPPANGGQGFTRSIHGCRAYLGFLDKMTPLGPWFCLGIESPTEHCARIVSRAA
jgi:hypothetical protein